MTSRAWRMFPAWSLAFIAVGATAHAADVTRCVDASEKAQQLRDDGKLIDAREQFLICAAETCPKVIQADCLRNIDEVSMNLSSVVLSARDATGQDILEVRVTVDGHPFAQRLDGKAAFIPSGQHKLRFETAEGLAHEQVVIIRQGEKNRLVSVVLNGPNHGSATKSPSGEPGAAERPRTEPSSADAPSMRRTAGFVVGAVGVAALGLGGYFGVRALGKRSDSDSACPDGHCTAEGVSLNDDAKSAAWISDIALGAGLVGVGVGAYLVLTSSGTSASSSAAVAGRARLGKGSATMIRLIPAVSPHGGGFDLTGRF